MKIRNNLLLILVTVIAITIATSSIYAEDKIDLRLRLENGKSYKMRTVQDIKLIQTVDGKQRTEIIKIGTGQIYDIEEVDSDGTTWVKVAYHSTSVKDWEQKEGEPITQRTDYDSSNPPDVIPREIIGLNALVGQSYSIMVSPQGHIKDMKGIESLQNAVIEKIPAIPEGEISFGPNDMLKEEINKEALNESMDSKFAIYPDKPVGIGDSWQKRTTISHCSVSNLFSVPQIVDTIYTLKERKNGIAIIDVFSMFQPNLRVVEVGSGRGIGKYQFKLSGDSTGTIEVEESTGWVIRSKQTLRLNGQAVQEYPQLLQDRMIIPVSITNTITQEPY